MAISPDHAAEADEDGAATRLEAALDRIAASAKRPSSVAGSGDAAARLDSLITKLVDELAVDGHA